MAPCCSHVFFHHTWRFHATFSRKDRDSIGMFFDAGGSNFGDATQFFATRTKGRNDVTGAGSGELPRDDRFFLPEMARLGEI